MNDGAILIWIQKNTHAGLKEGIEERARTEIERRVMIRSFGNDQADIDAASSRRFYCSDQTVRGHEVGRGDIDIVTRIIQGPY